MIAGFVERCWFVFVTVWLWIRVGVVGRVLSGGLDLVAIGSAFGFLVVTQYCGLRLGCFLSLVVWSALACVVCCVGLLLAGYYVCLIVVGFR